VTAGEENRNAAQGTSPQDIDM